MKGRTANPLIQQLITHGSEQKPIDLSVNRLHQKNYTLEYYQ